MRSQLPQVSIITVNFNMADGLARTISSVRGQDFPSYEHIVIDGGSEDESVRVIQEAADGLAYWVSEADRGIYDAMNKGVARSSGQWVLFLNSGDSFTRPDVLSRSFSVNVEKVDILYGDALVRYESGATRVASAAPATGLAGGMICSHQALFARRDWLIRFPFTLGKIRSDYEFLLRCVAQSARFKMIQVVIAEVEAGGLSDRNRIEALRERSILLRRAGMLDFRSRLRLATDFVLAWTIPPLKNHLPNRAVDFLRRIKLTLFGASSARG
jgi:glycosyltransferase involved in cell wall biosynthesis